MTLILNQISFDDNQEIDSGKILRFEIETLNELLSVQTEELKKSVYTHGFETCK